MKAIFILASLLLTGCNPKDMLICTDSSGAEVYRAHGFVVYPYRNNIWRVGDKYYAQPDEVVCEASEAALTASRKGG